MSRPQYPHIFMTFLLMLLQLGLTALRCHHVDPGFPGHCHPDGQCGHTGLRDCWPGVVIYAKCK